MTPLQIDIIKKFGRKELTAGCLIFRKEKQAIHQMDLHDLPCDEGEIWRERGNAEPYLLMKDFEILGHLPHLEDIFRVAEEEGGKIWVSDVNKIEGAIRGYSIVFIRPYESWITPYSPTLPLIEQDETTLSQLLSLFK